MPDSHQPWTGGTSEPLLKTKLFVPQVRPGCVTRPRLFTRIDQGLSRRLTLISAPAGSGKTTLLSEWCETETGRKTPLAWVSLEGADNHPQRFWLYVVQALERVRPGGLQEVLQMLGGPQPAPLEHAIRLLINQMAELEQDAILVLDDYHAITSEAIHQSVAMLLDHLPPRLHLMMTTRADPPLPLNRLRARRDLVEIRLKDLRFTPDEAAAFFRDAMRLPLTDRQVRLLEERTEGWIAGLQLAALSLDGLTDVDQFVDAFAGSHQYIVDYLVEEVLQLQPERVRHFLLRTAILDRLSAPLCEALTGEDDAQAMLESLEKRNLFVMALDHQRQWYRYHHLFAEVLRDRLHREWSGEAADLHREASLWYEGQGLVEPAVDHALAAGDYEQAARLMAVTAEQIWHRGDSGLLITWLKALPDNLIRSRPDLAFSLAWACMTTGRLEEAESLLQGAEEGVSEAGELLGKILATRGHVARLQLNFTAAVEHAQRALQVLPPESVAWRGWAVWNLGAVHRWRGELNQALERYAEAKHLFREAGDLYGFLRATVWNAEVMADGGRLPEAMAEAESALAMAQEQVGADLPVVALGHLGVGEMLYERYDLEGAEHHLQRCLELSRQGGLLDVVWLACIPLALVKQGQGDPRAALAYLDEADRIAPRVPWSLATCASARARLLQVQGEWERAAPFVRQMEGLARQQGAPYQRAARTLAYLKLGQGYAEEALAILQPIADRPGHKSTRLLALLALVQQTDGQPDRALVTLEEALRKAEPGGHAAAFLELGQPMADLLVRGTQRWKGPLAVFVRQLLDLFGAVPAASARQQTAASLIDPPSERELEVLALLAEGAPNEVIARRLFITIHTAKKHVANLLSKLGAANRTQAVAKARELGLL